MAVDAREWRFSMRSQADERLTFFLATTGRDRMTAVEQRMYDFFTNNDTTNEGTI